MGTGVTLLLLPPGNLTDHLSSGHLSSGHLSMRPDGRMADGSMARLLSVAAEHTPAGTLPAFAAIAAPARQYQFTTDYPANGSFSSPRTSRNASVV
jgi:hypothetical protein